MDLQDTFVAVSTPHGESAIGLIRCSGPGCLLIVQEVFRNASPTPRHSYYGSYKARSGDTLDQVVYVYFERDASYTGDSMLEISCHGNPYILQHVLEDLIVRGCRHALPGEFTQTAFLNGRMDLSQAEAVIDLIKARTDLAFKAASHQLQGSLSKRINLLVENLLQVLAEIEAYIDFPEEDLPSEGEHAPNNRIGTLKNEIDTLSETSKTGIFLREGVQAIIIGEPNAGKSSLLNLLLGKSRAIVSDQPGTTRDYIEDSFFVEPYRINILDTAGIHETDDTIEKEGISKTLEQIGLSDIILLTIDVSSPPPLLPPAVEGLLHLENTIVIRNKSDLQSNQDSVSFMAEYLSVDTSALNETGLETLTSAISKILGNPIVSEQGDVVAVSARHHQSLESAAKELETAKNLLDMDEPAELVSNHIRDAMVNLENIVGRIDNERMLDKLFASFCIGK